MIRKQDVNAIIDSYIHEIITESGTDKNAHTNKILRQIKSDIDSIPTSDNVLDEISEEIKGFSKYYLETEKVLEIIDEYRSEELCMQDQ